MSKYMYEHTKMPPYLPKGNRAFGINFSPNQWYKFCGKPEKCGKNGRVMIY